MMYSFFAHLHLVTAILGFSLGLLLMWAFRSYAFVRFGTATQHFGAALFWLSCQAVGRSIWWDVFTGFGLSNSANWMWNTLFIFAAWHSLKGVYASIPHEDRKNYNLLTGALYPSRLWGWVKDNGDKV